MNCQYIEHITGLLKIINKNDYTFKNEILSNYSIGAHVRHSIEMYTCVIDNYNNGEINYGLRKRDIELETSPSKATEVLIYIDNSLSRKDKFLTVIDENRIIPSSYFREILYCNEHLVHHLALIKISLGNFPYYQVSDEFGVARSTLQYQKSCVR
jgi:hypothetical protein